jgi:serine/threonine protein kinase
MNLEPGLRVTDSIELRSLIGEGGMGQVWSAFHLTLRREVAVKFLSGPLAENAAALQRFSLEAQTIGRLQCPYVPQIFDFGTMPDGAPFIVMELLEGVDLQSRLEKDGALSLEQTELLVSQMCTVLSLAHGLGLIHRDIKPDNIVLIPGEGDAFTTKLLDFGIVKALDVDMANVTRTGTTIGTPSYMSPEQLVGASVVDARADLWSLAVVAYSCLTGKLPFAGETLGAVCLAIHNGTFIDPSSHRSGLPVTLDAWFRKALDRAPEERFASAAEMSAALSVAIVRDPTAPPLTSTSGLPPGTSTTTAYLLTQPKRTRPRKRRFMKTVVSILAVAALVVVALGTWDPASSPDWSLAGRLGRTLVGALGRRATSFANSGPPPSPIAELPHAIAPLVDANAPEPIVAPPPIRPTVRVPVARSAPPRVAAAHSQAPGVNAVDPVSTAIPSSSDAPVVAAPSPATDNPYEP